MKINKEYINIVKKDENIINGEILDVMQTTSLQEFYHIIVNHFLGRNYYVEDPLSAAQIRTIVINDILEKYQCKVSIWQRIKNWFTGDINDKLKDLYHALLISRGYTVHFLNEDYLDQLNNDNYSSIKNENNRVVILYTDKEVYLSKKVQSVHIKMFLLLIDK